MLFYSCQRIRSFFLSAVLIFLIKSSDRQGSCFIEASSSTGTIASPLLLRIRQKDGSIRRVLVSSAPERTPLSNILLPNESDFQVLSSKDGKELDHGKMLSELNLAHNGTLITLRDATSPIAKSSNQAISSSKQRFDPYPDLAKTVTYSRIKAILNAKGTSRRSTSFADIEKLQSSMHKIEPEAKSNALKRLYMDHDAAERFQSSCFITRKTGKKKGSSSTTIKNKVGLLLGTVHRERVQTDRRVRTSLSSTTESTKKCTVVKVHAIWDPETSTTKSGSRSEKNDKTKDGKYYNAEPLHDCTSDRVLEIAAELGMQPVGWIYTYSESSKVRDEAQVPVLVKDVWNAAKIQAHMMESPQLGRDKGANFVTLAMDVSGGATEGFQLCDVAVQMVAENVLTIGKHGNNGNVDERYFYTMDPVIVDGQETNEVDCVLCLVNTAMLSHRGKYSGKETVLTKNGVLTGKAKKKLLLALKNSDSEKLLMIMSDFQILCGLDRLLAKKDMLEIFRLVNKYNQGQKRSTDIGQKLRTSLQNTLGGQ